MADRRRIGAALVTALLLIGSAPAAAMAVTPADGGALLNFYPVTINTSAGDQFDPHLSGDLASYTSIDAVHVYDFFSGTDVAIPGEVGAQDQLSDIDGGRVVFSRVGATGVPVLVYDVASAALTEIDPHAGTLRFSAAIGSATVAFIDYGVASNQGKLFVANLGGPTIQVTNDAAADRSPQVAPSGNAVVYESCEAHCDIHRAAWDGSNWIVTALTSNGAENSNPDTDGQVVVYDSTRSGERDIWWQPVGGGPEQRIALAGEQRDPSVSNGLIAFESVDVGDSAADLFVYQISTNRLFRITSTPSDDSLNDITVLPDGRGRVVWSSGDAGARDVYGATFELPPAGPTYHFSGFAGPVDALPTLNAMKAGAAVPVKFSLGADYGLGVFASGYPKSQTINCDATAPVDGVELTVSAGGSSLTYDPTTGLYTYVWKTDKAWAGTCRQLVIGFTDGSFARANFKFK